MQQDDDEAEEEQGRPGQRRAQRVTTKEEDKQRRREALKARVRRQAVQRAKESRRMRLDSLRRLCLPSPSAEEAVEAEEAEEARGQAEEESEEVETEASPAERERRDEEGARCILHQVMEEERQREHLHQVQQQRRQREEAVARGGYLDDDEIEECDPLEELLGPEEYEDLLLRLQEELDGSPRRGTAGTHGRTAFGAAHRDGEAEHKLCTTEEAEEVAEAEEEEQEEEAEDAAEEDEAEAESGDVIPRRHRHPLAKRRQQRQQPRRHHTGTGSGVATEEDEEEAAREQEFAFIRSLEEAGTLEQEDEEWIAYMLAQEEEDIVSPRPVAVGPPVVSTMPGHGLCAGVGTGPGGSAEFASITEAVAAPGPHSTAKS